MEVQRRIAPSYLALCRPTSTGWSGWFPELLGAGAVAETLPELLDDLREVLALHLYGMAEDNEIIPPARLAVLSDVDPADLRPDSQAHLIEPVELNPVSLEIGKVIRSSGLSLRELEKRTGISYAVLSRLKDPFYWGHSMSSIRAFAKAFNLEPRLEFIAA